MSREAFDQIISDPGPARAAEQTRPVESQEQAGPKIGAGHVAAMGRLGAHELTQALAAFPDSNIKPMEEPGILGNPTPQIVTQEMGGLKDISSTGRDFSLQDILDAPSQPTPPSQQDRDMGREI